MCWSVSTDVRTSSVSTTSHGSGTRSSKETMLVHVFFSVVLVIMVTCSFLRQLDSHRSRHGFTPVGELDQCVHFKVGESLVCAVCIDGPISLLLPPFSPSAPPSLPPSPSLPLPPSLSLPLPAPPSLPLPPSPSLSLPPSPSLSLSLPPSLSLPQCNMGR